MIIFSIIIPTYNRGHLISKAISSALSQSTDTDFEVIVVDDGSTDNTEEIVKTIQNRRIRYIKKENGERGAARNTGIQNALGNYITFLDSDDFLYPNYLAVASTFLNLHNNPPAIHVAYDVLNTEGKLIRKINHLNDINTALIKGNPISCLGIFIQKDIMIENLFNEDRQLSGMEDWEVWLRIASRYKWLACNTVTSALIEHDERSVLDADREKLVLKCEKFCYYIKKIQPDFSISKKIIASALTYTSLHLALNNAPVLQVWNFMQRGISLDFYELFRKRTWVIFKLMLFNYNA